jgi:hypothetical protein
MLRFRNINLKAVNEQLLLAGGQENYGMRISKSRARDIGLH